jgi:hypothetical protein
MRAQRDTWLRSSWPQQRSFRHIHAIDRADDLKEEEKPFADSGGRQGNRRYAAEISLSMAPVSPYIQIQSITKIVLVIPARIEYERSSSICSSVMAAVDGLHSQY